MGHGDRPGRDGFAVDHDPEPTSVHIAAAFGPDGNLWRIAAGRRHVYVDRSADLGNTFGPPVEVNREPQGIKVDSENRPDITVDRRGRIYVSYTAEGQQPTTLYVSVSTDGGHTFSAPIPASDQAAHASSFQGRIRRSPDDRVYLFWHDERDRAGNRDTGKRHQVVGFRGDEQLFLGDRAGRDEAHDVALHHGFGATLLGLGGILDLLADGDAMAERLTTADATRVLMAGFGVGLSWAGAAMTIPRLGVAATVQV